MRDCELFNVLTSFIMECGTVTEPWFSNLRRTSRKSTVSEPDNEVIGILAFEVASLMSKVVKCGSA